MATRGTASYKELRIVVHERPAGLCASVTARSVVGDWVGDRLLWREAVLDGLHLDADTDIADVLERLAIEVRAARYTPAR